MLLYKHLFIGLLLGWLCLLPFVQAQDQDRIGGLHNRPLPQARKPVADVVLPLATENLLRSPQVVLPPPPASMRNDLMQRIQQTRNAPGVPMRVGTERSIEQTGTPDRLRAVSPPVLQPNGSYRVTLKVRSPKALAVRLGLQFTDVDHRVSLRFFASDAQTQYGPTTHGEEILDLLSKNMASNDLTDKAVTWWSPTVDGDAIFVVVPAKFISSQHPALI